LMIQNVEKMIEDKDRMIENMGRMLQENDRSMEDKDKILQERNVMVQERDWMPQERDTMLQQKDRMLAESAAALRERDALIDALRAERADLESRLSAAVSRADEAEVELSLLRGTHAEQRESWAAELAQRDAAVARLQDLMAYGGETAQGMADRFNSVAFSARLAGV